MSPRVTSEFWVAAYVRQCFQCDAFAAVTRRGAAEAGVIMVVVDRLDCTFDLYTPAPQSFFNEEDSGLRRFELRLAASPREELEGVFVREARMDPDFWVVEVESAKGEHFLPADAAPAAAQVSAAAQTQQAPSSPTQGSDTAPELSIKDIWPDD
ncbi:DUF1491 family protein [Polycladidibacter hongkongensis]|uniref:DUF1491 family protein n=1 Tax=Polycladidibacter hongkongensis TaxID=1647556 RepID=UPI0009E7A4E9|nr:DUF1491 family protein [Pseudovibrio hongkongensis]